MHYKKSFILIILTILMLATASCGAAPPASESMGAMDKEIFVEEAMEAPEAPMPQTAMDSDTGDGTELNTASETVLTERVIIYTGDMEMVAEDVSQTMAKITELAPRQGGYVASSNVHQSDFNLYGNITIRVDAARYQETLVRLREMALRVSRENTSSQDVTEEFVDLEARRTNLEYTENALQEMLENNQQNNDIDDILKVQRELTSVREEIERIEGRLRYLRNQSALATIHVSIYPEEDPEPEVIPTTWQPLKVAKDAWQTLTSVLRNLGDLLIWFGICGLPLLVLVLIPLAILRWGFVRWRKNRPEKETAKPEAASIDEKADESENNIAD